MIGNKIENFRITSVLGEGGMGVVYKAFDLKLERYVALKILNQKAVTNPQFVERFKREAKNQAQLSHPNIVPVYGFTDEQNMLGFVMEYVNGETLETVIEKGGRVGLLDALEIMKQILGGASYAHSKGFIHRDLKPSNVIFTQDGIAKIMDFGISKSIYESKGITKSGVKIGTLLYMSPEQIKGYEPTQQSDVYSLGVIFYEMLLGKNPFDGNSDFEIMEAHLKKYPPRISTLVPDFPEEIDRIIFKALAKSADRRYKDCMEFYNDIDQELTRLKSEQRKTHETIIKREQFHENRLVAGTYVKFAAGIIISVFLVYFSYTTISRYVAGQKKQNENITVSPDEQGRNWSRISSPVNESLTGISFVNKTGIICGLEGTLLISSNSGESWKKVPLETTDDFYSLVPLNDNIFLITSENGTIYKLMVSDLSLKKIDTQFKNSFFSSFFLPENNTCYICGSNGIIIQSSDKGETWRKLNSDSDKLLYKIYFKDTDHGYASGWDGEFLVTEDGGKSWRKFQQFTSNYLRGIAFISDKTGFVVGGEGEIFRTTDSGATWKKINSGISSGLYFISFINEQNGYILGSKGEILYSEDQGENWKPVQSGSYVPLTNITLSRDNNLFTVGYNGTILVSRL